MARTKGARNKKTLQELMDENETKIRETKELLNELYTQQKELEEKQEKEDTTSLVSLIKSCGFSVAEAKEFFVSHGRE